MPTLFCRMSSRPYRWTAAAARRPQSSGRETSHSKIEAVPPSPEILATVSAARLATWSAQSTCAPSRAKRIAAALPLPSPAPLDPAPVTIATLPASRPVINYLSTLPLRRGSYDTSWLGAANTMSINPSAGQPADPAQLVDLDRLTAAYYSTKPDPTVASQRIAFGTSGHRGSALHAAFNEDHILAVVEAT